MAHWNQLPFPVMQSIEKGRFCAPDYDTPLRDIEIHTSEWRHLASARFGPARRSPALSAYWSGDCYRYDIFDYPDRQWIAIRWWNGSGEGWLVDRRKDDRGEQSLIRHITQLPSETMRWDFCHFLYETAIKSALAGTLTGEERYRDAFLEGRLKIRRKQGKRTVKIEIRPPDPYPSLVQGPSKT